MDTAEEPMSVQEWSTDNCTIARTLGVLGEKWTIHVMREVFVGVRRFEDMRARTQIPRQVLSNRLAALVDRGLLRREPYRVAGQRERHEYKLTRAGLDLYPVLTALISWGDQHLAVPEGPPLRVEHRDCGRDVQLQMRCAAGHEVPPRQATIRPGPGAHRRPGRRPAG
jgi:DNA-binding HxlR family transcriptional regulator